MSDKCIICARPDRESIDKMILAGESLRNIGKQFGVSYSTVRRHTPHIPKQLAKSHEIMEIARADNLLDQTRILLKQAQEITDACRSVGDSRTALQGIARIKDLIELLMKVNGELEQKTEINIISGPVWIETRTVILNALQPYPDARAAVVRALEDSCNQR